MSAVKTNMLANTPAKTRQELRDWPDLSDSYRESDRTLPDCDPESPLRLAIAPHKCGSTWLQYLIAEIASRHGIPFFSPESYEYNSGRPLGVRKDELTALFARGGRTLGVFRSHVPELDQWISDKHTKVLLLIRDPRDVVCSYYKSMVKTHALPDSGEARASILSTRENFGSKTLAGCLRAGELDHVFYNMLTLSRLVSEAPSGSVIRYEQVIYDPSHLVERLIDFLDLQISPLEMRFYVAQALQRDEGLANAGHIDAPTPGRYRRELGTAELDYIYDNWAGVMWELGYIPEL